jgi:hypothetical protein
VFPNAPVSSACEEREPYPFRVLRRSVWRLVLVAVVAFAVLVVGGYRVIRHLYAPIPPSADQLMQDVGHTAAAMKSSESANFTTQVSGLTVMFGTARERVTPTRLATLSITSVDGADRFSVTEVVTKSTVYVRMPSLAAAIGKPWLGVPVPQLGAYPAMAQLYQTAALPTAEAALVGTASTERMTGTTTVRGVKVARYAGRIDPATALSELRPDMRQLLAPELAATTGTITFTVWIDSLHNLRKVQTSATIGGQLTVTTVVVTAVNQALHIAVPLSSQVASLPRQSPAAS